MEITGNSKFAEDRIQRVVTRLRRVYLALAILGGLFTLSSIVGQSGIREILEGGLQLIIYAAAFIGLRRRRSWVVPLVLIISAFGCFVNFGSIMYPATDIGALVGKIFNGLLLFFFVYQIAFFVKREVRSFFGTRGQVLF
jgi:hypothetical protein